MRDDLSIKISNALGQNVYAEKLSSFIGKFDEAIDIRKYGKGIYMLSVSNSKNQTVRRVVTY